MRDLKRRTISASAWAVGGAFAGNVIRLLSNLILTRLLFPEAFGLMLMASTVGMIIAMLSDVGIQQSIIRGKRGEDPVFLDTAWTFQIIRGVVMWLGACVLAAALHLAATRGWLPPLSTYSDPRLPWIIAVSAFSAVVQGFQATDLATATRRMIVKPLVLMETFAQLAGVLLMVALAWWMRSVWALVIAGLVTTLLQTLASHVLLRIHRNRLRIDRQSLLDLVSFGKWLALSSAVSVFVTNGDRLILGALVSASTLGLFSIAVTLAGAVNIAFASLVGKVFFPLLSEVTRNHPERLAETFNRLRWRADPILLVVGGALFALGPSVVQILYDTRYQDAGRMLQILSLALVVDRFAIAQQAYLALGEPRYQVVLNIVRAIALYSTVPAAFHFYGITGALYAIALREVVAVPLIVWFNAKHGLNNFRFEMLWLVFWPAGWLLGVGLVAMYAWVTGAG